MRTSSSRWPAAFAAIVASLALLGIAHAGPDRTGPDAVIREATKAVKSFKKNHLSKDLLKSIHKAQAVLIVPDYERAGMAVGGEGGKGVLLKRTAASPGWSYPAFFELSGASFGAQIGFEKGALLMTMNSDAALNHVLVGNVALGAEARAIAGSKGVRAESIDMDGHQIDAFVLSKGAFVGALVKGGEIKPAEKLNLAYYGTDAIPSHILKANGPKNHKADGLRKALAALANTPLPKPGD